MGDVYPPRRDIGGKKECGAAGSSPPRHTLSFGVGRGIDMMTFEKLCTPFQQTCHRRPLYVILERAQHSLWSTRREQSKRTTSTPGDILYQGRLSPVRGSA